MERIILATPHRDAMVAVKTAFPKAVLRAAEDTAAFIRLLAEGGQDFILADLDIFLAVAGERPKDWLRNLWRANQTVETVILCQPERIRQAVDMVKAGASNYLTYPLDPVEVRYVLESLEQARLMQSEVEYLRSALGRDGLEGAVVESGDPAMAEVYEQARLVAPTISTVLIAGETGTGKGVLARHIHALSNRARGPFVAVNCGALSEQLLESELFGHEKGAFTGAVKRKLGRFEIAAGGTIFLDEISTIGPSAQVKLLQVLQDKVFQRVGGEVDISSDVRVIAATNADLKQSCEAGQFRSDLYYRLNVFPLQLPPLRERTVDIPLLADHFVQRLSRTHGKDIDGCTPEVLAMLKSYSWPGNVRELENLLERAIILETSRTLTPESFPRELAAPLRPQTATIIDIKQPLAEARERAASEAERQYLKEVLAEHLGRIDRTAAAAGITSRQLNKLMHKHGLKKEEFKRGRG